MVVGGYYMPFAPHYAVYSAHPPLPLHPKVPRPWALDTYSTVSLLILTYAHAHGHTHTMLSHRTQ